MILKTLRILSDLHLEFHRDNGLALIKELGGGNDEILILAGDIANGLSLLNDALLLISVMAYRLMSALEKDLASRHIKTSWANVRKTMRSLQQLQYLIPMPIAN